MLTELREEKGGMVWLGKEEARLALIYGRKAGVMLRGEALEA